MSLPTMTAQIQVNSSKAVTCSQPITSTHGKHLARGNIWGNKIVGQPNLESPTFIDNRVACITAILTNTSDDLLTLNKETLIIANTLVSPNNLVPISTTFIKDKHKQNKGSIKIQEKDSILKVDHIRASHATSTINQNSTHSKVSPIVSHDIPSQEKVIPMDSLSDTSTFPYTNALLHNQPLGTIDHNQLHGFSVWEQRRYRNC